MKSISTILIVFFSFNTIFFSSSFANAACSSRWDTSVSPELEEFINDFNPFWGTWTGSYDGHKINGSFYLDQQNYFNIKGTYKNTDLNNIKVKLCYTNGRFQAMAYGFRANIEILSSRRVRVHHFLLNAPVTLQR